MVATKQQGLGRLVGERLLLIGGLFVYANLGYFWTGSRQVDPASLWDLRTPLDDLIPFVPAMMWFYAWVYTAMVYPAFAVGPRSLFRRVALAYLVLVSLNLVGFLVFPASALAIRPDAATLEALDLSWFHNWGLRVNYALDTPNNLFPSLHMSSATLATLCAWRARPLYGYVAAPVVVLIGISIVAVRQHFAIDGVAGVVLGAAVYAALVHRWTPAADEVDAPTALTWRGPAAYLAFHASVYAALYSLFLAGVRPWA